MLHGSWNATTYDTDYVLGCYWILSYAEVSISALLHSRLVSRLGETIKYQ